MRRTHEADLILVLITEECQSIMTVFLGFFLRVTLVISKIRFPERNDKHAHTHKQSLSMITYEI